MARVHHSGGGAQDPRGGASFIGTQARHSASEQVILIYFVCD
jgi:hypothetical protein